MKVSDSMLTGRELYSLTRSKQFCLVIDVSFPLPDVVPLLVESRKGGAWEARGKTNLVILGPGTCLGRLSVRIRELITSGFICLHQKKVPTPSGLLILENNW